MRATKICLTMHSFGQGGTDRVCAHLAQGFAAAGFDIEVIILCAGGKGETALRPLLGEQVRLTFLGRRSKRRWLDMILMAPALASQLRHSRPDCVLSTGNNMNWVTVIAARVAGVSGTKLVLKMTNPIIRPHDNAITRAVRTIGYGLAFRKADRILALSDGERRQLSAAYPYISDRFVTVFNPYVTDQMLETGRMPHNVTSRLVIGVGRLHPQKRLDLLVRAFAKVTAPSVRLVLLGDGSERGRLQALVQELDLTDRIEIAGFVSNVPEWFSRADVFVLSSVYEGLPAVVLEAMAANCPVIATDCFQSARDLVGMADGCAIVAAEPDSIAAAIDHCLARSRPVSLRPIAQRYGIKAAIASHVQTVEEVLGRANQSPPCA